MQFLKQVDADFEGSSFKATMFNDKTTDNYDAACFFMMCQDEDYDIDQAKSMISAGRQIDPSKPWDEIERLVV